MIGVAQVISGQFEEYYHRTEAIDEALHHRVSELFGRRGYAPEGETSILSNLSGRITKVSSDTLAYLTTWLPLGTTVEPPKIEGVPKENEQMSSHEKEQYREIEELLYACDHTREKVDLLSVNLKQTQIELIEMSRGDAVLSPFQQLHVEEKLLELLDQFLELSSEHMRLILLIHKLDSIASNATLKDDALQLRVEIDENREELLRSIDQVRSMELTETEMRGIFARYGRPILDFARRNHLDEQAEPENAVELRSIISRLESRGAVEGVDVMILVRALSNLQGHEEETRDLLSQLMNKTREVVHRHPNMIRTLVPSLAFGIGLITGGPVAAFTAKIVASATLEKAVPALEPRAPETEIAVAAIEAGVGAAIAGPEGAISSVGASLVNAAPEPVRDLAVTGSIAYMARLTGVSVTTAAQMGMMGTLAVKNQQIVTSVGSDLVAVMKLVRNPRGIPRALFSAVRGVFSRLAFAAQQGRWEELLGRSIFVLTPLAGLLLGLTGVVTTVTMGFLGSYVVDKFFVEERRFEGKATLHDPEFVEYVLEEYHLEPHAHGFERLSSLFLQNLDRLGGEEEEARQVLDGYDTLKQRLRLQNRG